MGHVIVLKDTGEAINVDTYFKSGSDDYVFHSMELEFWGSVPAFLREFAQISMQKIS